MLAKLSNIDKHRRLNTTVTRVDRRETFISTRGFTYTLIQPALSDGAKIDAVLPLDFFGDIVFGESDVHTDSEFTAKIAFNEPDVGPPQTALLDELIYFVPVTVFQVFLGFKELLH